MWWTLLLPLVIELRPILAELPSQATVTPLQITQQGPRNIGASNATSSPCYGLPTTATMTLNLRNRSLDLLPGCLPQALHTLEGSYNLLRALGEAELGHLPQLRALKLSHNLIAALHWGPGWPAGLHMLDLSYNRLAALPPCAGPALSNLSALSLAGNPLQELQPDAFSCLPALSLLNLSFTALGRGAQPAIAEGTFAGAGALEVLDLSGTFLTHVQSEWMRDLPKLTSLHLQKMPRLKSLQGDIFKMTPNLQQLDCQDSPELTSVHTHIFQDTPHLQLLLFQNCNLSSFPPWTLHSSQFLSINLAGNPLTCSCELSWLLVDVKRTVLNRAADTVCTPAAVANATFSAPLLLSQLPSVCHVAHTTTLQDSSPASSVQPTHIQGPLTQASTTCQNVTMAPSLAMDPPRETAWPLSTGGQGGTGSTPASTAASSNPGTPASAAGPTGTEFGELSARLVFEPNGSAASSALTPTSRNPLSILQPERGTQAIPQGPRPTPSDGGIPVFLLDDSSEEPELERELERGLEVGAPPRDAACDYHPCKHLQTPCAELQRRSRCRCPGLSGAHTVPELPVLQGVSETTDTSALIRWCAPNSVVQGYQIRYSAEGRPGNQSVVADIYATARQHPLYGLAPATTYRVCVLAANAAGLSPLPAAGGGGSAGGACGAFTTKPSFLLILAGLSAASGLLLLSTLLLAVCLCRRAPTLRPQRPNTHLVAYKNPAFDYPLKL